MAALRPHFETPVLIFMGAAAKRLQFYRSMQMISAGMALTPMRAGSLSFFWWLKRSRYFYKKRKTLYQKASFFQQIRLFLLQALCNMD
mgnify:CR=1 FL=1